MALDGERESWWVKTNDKVYGPYTRVQMGRFIVEGRITATTLVSANPEGDWNEARHCKAFRSALHEERTTFHVNKSERRAEAEQSNMLVWTDLISGAGRRVELELRKLGPVAEVSAGVYMLRTRKTAGMVRNAVSQALERGDKVLVVDASRDRLAWFNLGPETDVHIREVWNARLETMPEIA
ncbi:MAG: GYF domain-containing protein [Alphaproteobacteria bacterium]